MSAQTMGWPVKWMAVRERLRRELGAPIFDAWIAPLSLESFDHGEIRLGADKAFARNWVENHYTARIERAFRAVHAEPSSLSVIVRPARIAAQIDKAPAAVPAPAAPALPPLWARVLHPQETFDSFIPGQDNEFGYKAARAFAENHGGDVPLLYIYGGIGIGKTHLLNAVALEFNKLGQKVLFLRAEDFMRHFLGAVYRKETLAFKDELRLADVLIIDDLQHICRSTATASEFLYTINALADLRRRVVIAADRAPAALEGLSTEVKSRISGGLVIQLRKPDRDTKLAILKYRAAAFARLRPGVAVPDDVLDRIADKDASPREMIAIFTKLATYADLTKMPVTVEMAEEAVGRCITNADPKISIEDIQKKTAEFYKLEVRDFHSPERARRVARPRQVAMYLARKLTTRSLPEIGHRFGGRDHTTVLHACRRVESLCHEDPMFKQEVDFLRSTIAAAAHR